MLKVTVVSLALLVVVAALVASVVFSAPPPIAFVRVPMVAFGPTDLTLQVRIAPIAADRLLTAAAWDVDVDPPIRVQYSEQLLEGENSRHVWMFPARGGWRLAAGDYVLVATIGSAAGVRARVEQKLLLKGLN